MDSPLGRTCAPELTLDDRAPPPAPSTRRAGLEDEVNPWLGLPEQRQADAQSVVALGADPEIGPQAGYWRYLQSFSWSESEALKAEELLELLLHLGRSSPKAGALASQLLDRFGSLGAVVAAEPTKLAQVLGGDGASVILLKAVRASVKAILREPIEERPVLGSASALMDYLSVTMRHETIESARILFLDRKNALIKDEVHNRGTIDHTPLYPREVVKRVLELGACAIILVHNHPSGDPTPSQGDIEMTHRLAAALGTINVLLHDHVIVGRNRETSLRKLKLI